MNGLLVSLLVGGIAGWLAGQAMKGGGYGVVVNILLGIVGAVVGQFVFGLLGIAAYGLIGNIIVAFFGAVIVIAVARAVSGRSPV